jgi:hypothetical protein
LGYDMGYTVPMQAIAPLVPDLSTAVANLTRADKAPLSSIVSELADWIGLGLTAMAGGVNETRYVRSWIEGTAPRRPEALRAAWRAAYVITALDGPETAKAWMMGQNPVFDFKAPVRVLREHNDDETRSAIVRAAVQFASA